MKHEVIAAALIGRMVQAAGIEALKEIPLCRCLLPLMCPRKRRRFISLMCLESASGAEKCRPRSDIATVLHPYAKQLEKVGLETGSWSSWLYHGLTDLGFDVACMDARQAHAALSVTVNKTDANDAEGLAHLLRTGLFRDVRGSRPSRWCNFPDGLRA